MKLFKPTTSSLRHLSLIDKSFLWKHLSFKPLVGRKLKHSGGRNNTGHITVFQHGGGSFAKLRIIDYKRTIYNIPATVVRIEYDPNRSSFLALIYYINGVYSYILAPANINTGQVLNTGIFSEVTFYLQVGNCTYLKYIPLGTIIHNIELVPSQGGRLIRAAGTSAQILKKYKNNLVLIKLKSGIKKLIPSNCKATIGAISNSDYRFINYGKAGRMRWLGIKPHVRAYAMNPVDHPMGGRTHGGKQLVTPWGLITKGRSTRHKALPIIKD